MDMSALATLSKTPPLLVSWIKYGTGITKTEAILQQFVHENAGSQYRLQAEGLRLFHRAVSKCRPNNVYRHGAGARRASHYQRA
jgi:hypothetical protein